MDVVLSLAIFITFNTYLFNVMNPNLQYLHTESLTDLKQKYISTIYHMKIRLEAQVTWVQRYVYKIIENHKGQSCYSRGEAVDLLTAACPELVRLRSPV